MEFCNGGQESLKVYYWQLLKFVKIGLPYFCNFDKVLALGR